jgi:PPOX class probable F420-dependent enzyme
MKLTAEQARARFVDARVARLATAGANGQPHLVPFTFVVSGTTIVHAIDHKPKTSTDLKRLRNIAENGHVAALVDEYSDDWTQLWWARADGTAEIHHEIGRPAAELLGLKYSQYQGRPPAGPWVVIRVDRWSGWSAA